MLPADRFEIEGAEHKLAQISQLSSEIIIRNKLLIYARVTDLQFIKFEFVCSYCNDCMLSLTKCLSGCEDPRPALKIQIMCSVQEKEGWPEATMCLENQDACRVFGINAASIDIFKEYFFTHGVFCYRTMGEVTTEYLEVVEFFKSANCHRKWLFECSPFY
jgi:hypothetical protein